MSAPRSEAEIKAAFLAACDGELRALKPGNVHMYAPGHGMEIAHFEKAAAAAAPHIAKPSLGVGSKIFRATESSFAATGLNVNLGIVLLCAPLANAAAQMDVSTGLRRRLAVILSLLDREDADQAFAAIRLANPAGLGQVEAGDVRSSHAPMTLIEAMHLAHHRDRIARAYVTAFEDIFDFALPALDAARLETDRPDFATTTLHMRLLAEFPDSHIARKFGSNVADTVMSEARHLRPAFDPIVRPKSLEKLKQFDSALKTRGYNPGTTADFVVATLFVDRISVRKQS